MQDNNMKFDDTDPGLVIIQIQIQISDITIISNQNLEDISLSL